jgi:MFS family permease
MEDTMSLRQTRAVRHTIAQARAVYDDYPRQFWLLVGASFIDMVGNALIFPFFALFLTDRFDVSMSRVGVIFALFSAAGLIGSTLGGALADRFGRKPIALSGLVISAFGNLSLALVPDFWMLYPLAVVFGLGGSIGGPAWGAMTADLLPENKRAEGFGIFRIVFNLAVTFGPMIGGLLAGVSYVLLFSVDAATSFVTAAILFVFLRETRPQTAPVSEGGETVPPETLAQTFRGYGAVLRDRVFVAFSLLGVLVWLVYMQMNTTLAVYLRDEHGVAPTGFGLLIAMNAGMVVVMQLAVTRRVRGYSSLLVLAAGTLLYAVGFSMYGYVSTALFFVLAMVIITVGEMMIVPVAQAVVTQLSPEHMRGRYMAVFGFGHAISFGTGVWLAGQIISGLGPEWVWYLGGIVAAGTALGYVRLHRAVGAQVDDAIRAERARAAAPEPALDMADVAV